MGSWVEQLTEAIIAGEKEDAVAAAGSGLAEGNNPLNIINEVLVPALHTVGSQYQTMEIFLPELVAAGDAAKAVSDLLSEKIASSGGSSNNQKVVILGTVEGDIHDIGKNIVGTILSAAGYKVIDLGRDVKPIKFIEEAEKSNAAVIAMSSLMTTTRPVTRNTIRLLTEMNLRSKYKVIVGGGCINSDWALQIGADGYVEDAAQTPELLQRLLS
ncbi:cobalamin-dependent protein [Moorella naiadis]|uniref:cobalamin B12-binding domain-containing protein n=1 Tax=Moorella naiadis (nom. illeg.) TaxID=3093670 RepID=UPI003D9CB9D6